MAEKTLILRVVKDFVLSKALEIQLEKLLGNYQLEYYTPLPDLKRIYQRRIDSLAAALLFALDSLPLEKKVLTEELTTYLNDCSKKYCLPEEGEQSEYQTLLAQHSAAFVGILMDHIDWSVDKELLQKDTSYRAIECLNKAEQYCLMKQRADLATLIHAGDELIIQWEQHLPPFSAQTLDELEQIKKSPFPAPDESEDNLPLWFLTLSAIEQYFLKKILAQSKTIPEAIFSLPSRARGIPGLANFARHSFLILKSNGELIIRRDCLRMAHIASREAAVPVEQLHADRNFSLLQQHADKRPLFYQTLISSVRNENQSFLTQIVTTPLLLYKSPDSRLDNQRLRLLNTELQNGRLYFSTNHPLNYLRFVFPTPASSLECNALLNMAKAHLALKNLPLLSESCSYAQIQDFVRAFSDDLEGKQSTDPEFSLLREQLSTQFKQSEFQELKRWPNWQQVLIEHLELSRQPAAKKEAYDAYQQRLADLDDLIKLYEELLNSSFGTGTFRDVNGRELCLSSLEQLIIMIINAFSCGSCVSGKDRKALELIHTDAMLLFRVKYGKWPSFFHCDEDRERFSYLFVLLYISRHHHKHADQMAPGAEGIKTPDGYLPANIYTKINSVLSDATSLKKDDYLATNNEVDAIPDLIKYLKANYSHCFFIVLSLSAQSIDSFLKNLAILIDEEKSQDSWLASLKAISQQQVSSNERLVEIFWQILQSPGSNEHSQMIYTSVLSLLNSITPQENFDTLVIDLKKMNQKSLCVQAAARLTEESIQRAIDCLCLVTQEKKFWRGEKTYKIWSAEDDGPTGIKAIRNLCTNSKIPPRQIMAEIYWEVLQRPSTSSMRKSSSTQVFYDVVLKLYKSEIPDLLIEEVINELSKIKTKAYKSNEESKPMIQPLPATTIEVSGP